MTEANTKLDHADVRAVLASLTPRQGLAFDLIYVQNLSMPQAAVVMGISARCVHKNYHRAIRNIKGKLLDKQAKKG